MGGICKTFALILTLIIVMSCLTILNIPMVLAQTGTNVNGIISQDTTWTKASSPYQLTGHITVNYGITLTVEAGTTVNLERYTIQILGILTAKGSNGNKIYFNGFSDSSSYQIIFNQSSTGWNENTNSGSIIEDSVVNVASIFIDNTSPKVNHNSIGGANVGDKVPAVISIREGSSIISNNTITSSFRSFAIEIEGGTPIVANNYIVNPYSVWTGIYVDGDNSAFVYGNSIIGSENGRFANGIFVRDGIPTIERNNIVNNAVGIAIDGDSQIKIMMQNNTVTRNEIAIRFGNNYATASTLRFNNIELGISTWAGPQLVDLDDGFIGPSYTINAVNNWWGTSDAQTVNQSINGELVNMGLGGYSISVTAIVIPVLTSPNSQALPEVVDLPEAIPYPSPYPARPSQITTPTSSPLPTPTESPTSTSSFFTSTPTSTGTGYPSIPFLLLTNAISLIVIASLLAVIITLLLLMRHRKITNQTKKKA